MNRPRWIASFLLAAACGAGARSTTATDSPTSTPTAPSAATWSNPGGMWLPEQMVQMADTLRALGLAILPSSLGDPSRSPLGAIVSLGGCSAAFVSPDGLIATNHHCVQGALMNNSTPAANLLERGFLARDRADERGAGATVHAYVATKMTDVSAQMTDGLAGLPDDLARHAALESREKKLLADCEKNRPELRCKVDRFFGGGSYQLVEQLDIRDLRLVYAPPRSVGNFGGEVDNWMWPRSSGDFALYRAYAAPDGRPADHAAGNLPYKPKQYVTLATRPLSAGDLVIVAGYPGMTRRLATAEEAEDAATWTLPRTIALNEQYLRLLDELTADSPDLRIKVEPKKRGLLNFLKKNRGVVATMIDGGVLGQKKAADANLLVWIDADPARKSRYGAAVERVHAILAESHKTRETDAAFTDLLKGSALLEQALAIVRLAEERARPDAERKLAFQERNWSRLVHASQSLQRSYARVIDRAVFKMFILRALALPAGERPAALAKIIGQQGDEKIVDAALDKLYGTTRLEDAERRRVLLQTATTPTIRAANEPFLKLALALLPDVKTHEAELEAREGALALALPLYVDARREQGGAPIAPDANGSLRLTYGHVVGPPRGGRAFTTLSELAAKATAVEPFDASPVLLDAIKQQKPSSPYTSMELGEVPVDFMSDTDITNGNSGSPTLNARGELVGLVFDGTLDTMASDWLYMKQLSRTIHVDIRYLLFYLDVIDNGQRLLVELGVKPAR
jgi:Peptidase S46